MQERTVRIQDVVAATPVEQVLVLETIGDIKDFENAVRRVPGLEWLFDLEDRVDPDEDFYFEGQPSQPLDRKLFLVMSDEAAVGQLLALWQRYEQAPNAPFPHGLGKWKSVFDQLRVLRLWDERDRLEPEILDYWRGELAAGRATIRFEIEVWYSASPQKNATARQALATLARELGGQVLSWAEISSTKSSGWSVVFVVLVIGSPFVRIRMRSRANACSRITLLASIGAIFGKRNALCLRSSGIFSPRASP